MTKSRMYRSFLWMGLWPAILLVVTVLDLSNATAFGQDRATVPSPPTDRREHYVRGRASMPRPSRNCMLSIAVL